MLFGKHVWLEDAWKWGSSDFKKILITYSDKAWSSDRAVCSVTLTPLLDAALCGVLCVTALNHGCPAATSLLPDNQLGARSLLKVASCPSVWCMPKCSLYVFCLAASGEGQM